MKLTRTVYFTDGTSGIVEFEKPPGAHPDSVLTAVTGINEAEKTGKTVIVGGLPIDTEEATRDQVFELMKKAKSPTI